MPEPFPVIHEGREVGEVTSACYSPRLETNIGLAMLPVALTEVDTPIEISTPYGHRPAAVTTVPFVPSRARAVSAREPPGRRSVPMSPYPHLFAPFTLGTRTLSNRIVSTAHGTGFAPDGRLTEDYLEYHLRKAAGGVGLTMAFGSASVHHRSTASYGSVSLW